MYFFFTNITFFSLHCALSMEASAKNEANIQDEKLHSTRHCTTVDLRNKCGLCFLFKLLLDGSYLFFNGSLSFKEIGSLPVFLWWNEWRVSSYFMIQRKKCCWFSWISTLFTNTHILIKLLNWVFQQIRTILLSKSSCDIFINTKD